MKTGKVMTNQSQNGNGAAFLPEGYETPKTSGNYMKLQKGENKFRILSRPIIGWLDWKDSKPVRFRMNEKPATSIDPKKPVKHFWAMVVYNYQEERIQVLEITQASVQGAIQSLTKDDDWGSPFGYDIKVIRKGEMLETEYTINPVPHKKITDEVQNALIEKGAINLEALYAGEDPFVGGPVDAPSDLPF